MAVLVWADCVAGRTLWHFGCFALKDYGNRSWTAVDPGRNEGTDRVTGNGRLGVDRRGRPQGLRASVRSMGTWCRSVAPEGILAP